MSHAQDHAGLIHVYTGDGKGKTTAALGLALRAAGHGLRTYVGQFMKGQEYGELRAAVLGTDDRTPAADHRAVWQADLDPQRGREQEDVRLARAGAGIALRAM